ncbi:hypothetical protein XENORESO_007054 [Xenotaenia resolanae]|uniref:Uncharacterized protein n=1 Tax=Xenotaenia resolanae TaxID=208358 RepID=A0ABV0X2Y2_9TELE
MCSGQMRQKLKLKTYILENTILTCKHGGGSSMLRDVLFFPAGTEKLATQGNPVRKPVKDCHRLDPGAHMEWIRWMVLNLWCKYNSWYFGSLYCYSQPSAGS